MSGSNISVEELFHLLESNKLNEVEETKQVFHDHFLSTKDNWLVNGLFNYYLSTNSLRAIELLCGVREPHDKHLLDRLNETIARPSNGNQRVQALTVLGHIARRQPTWLYKLANHSLFKELLKLLKCDTDSLSMMSALLLLVTLLPMLPAALGPYLHDIFDVFGRLASYHHAQCNNITTLVSINNPMDKDQLYLLHLQLGIYSLFHRLYAMYPCNFIYFLKNFYTQRDNDPVFKYTIKPMLDSVRMHPLIITASKDAEINAARWKKMEPHDVVAECGRFALDRNKEEILAPINNNLRATPLLDQHYSYTPVSIAEGFLGSKATNGTEEDIFWSPSMTITPHSPTPIQSTPSTPNNNINNNTNTNTNINTTTTSTNNNNSSNTNIINTTSSTSGNSNNTNNNNRSNSSPPEAAIEATPETTPVKDIRQISSRQQAMSSTAVRALGVFGNGYSRPSTPILNSNLSNNSSEALGIVDGGLLSSKINRLFADRQNVLQSQRMLFTVENNIGKVLENTFNQNGKNDSWNEDQEVLEIVNSRHERQINYNEQNDHRNLNDLTSQVKNFRTHSRYQTAIPCSVIRPFSQIRRSRSCLDLKFEEKLDKIEQKIHNIKGIKQCEEVCTQTNDIISYEYLLRGVLDQRLEEQQALKNSLESRLSPTSMLDKYIETCARVNPNNSLDKKTKNKKKGIEDDGNDDFINEESGIINQDYINQLQIIQMQLSFERQRREVHAERTRRLLGKLRDSRALEEHNSALTDRLRMAENEIEGLKHEMERFIKENRLNEDKYKETINYWQSKCVKEQQNNRLLKERVENFEFEMKKMTKKLLEQEQQIRNTDAALFDAGHKLKDALKAANRGEELKRIYDNTQKRFLLLGEALIKIQEKMNQPVQMSKENVLIQKAYSEELSNLRKQLDGRTSLIDALKSRLLELEAREVRKDEQLVNQQRLLQEAKERNEAELRAIESKYKAQVEINSLLESRILVLHGHLESVNSSSGLTNVNLGSSVSPKERSPPLSGSLASSSEGSLAFHSGTGIMSDYCDSLGEISNLQAIVEPAPAPAPSSTSSSSSQNTPLKITKK